MPPTPSLSIFDPASPPAAATRDLAILVFTIALLIFVVVEGVLIHAIVRFRQPRDGSTREPPQVYGSKPIEIAWTVAPVLIVVVLVLVTARTLWEVKPKPVAPRPGDDALFVTVIGRQWWWEFRYVSYDGQSLHFATANELHVPASTADAARPIHLTLKSADVCHSFWVPRLAGKTDLIPGRTNRMWFQTAQTGTFLGQCAEFCGTQHANMLLRVVVEPPEDFQRWLENQSKPAVEDPSVATGKAAFLAQTCVNCHRVRGTRARGDYAPDLTHVMSRETLAGGLVRNTPETLRAWVEGPQAIKPGCLMPAFGLDEGDSRLILSYLRTLR